MAHRITYRNHRSQQTAFTLIEMLVVIGIIVLLFGIALPVIFKMWHSAQITAQQNDFQTITTALEQYQQDFHDYPRHPFQQSRPVGGNTTYPAPTPYLSLAEALMGTGPAVTQSLAVGSMSPFIQVGDGNDGPGFRNQFSVFSYVQETAIPVGATQVKIDGGGAPLANQYSFSTLVLSPGMPDEESFGIQSITTAGSAPTFNYTVILLGNTPTFPHPTTDTAPVIRTAKGRVWGPYLPPDKFNLAYIYATAPVPAPGTTNDTFTPGTTQIGQPVILDHWGNPIQYLPRYGPMSNRTGDMYYKTPSPWLKDSSTSAPGTVYSTKMTTVLAGPLFGYTVPESVDQQQLGNNAIFDIRDAIPIAKTTPAPFDPIPMQWVLGDNDGNNFIDASAGESLQQNPAPPFLLISAGPNGVWCSFDKTTNTPLGQQFSNSGNIYNISR